MTLINNSFIRAIILILMATGIFALARYFGAQNVGSAMASVATVVAGVAAGALKDAESHTTTNVVAAVATPNPGKEETPSA